KLLLWTMEHVTWGTAPPRSGGESALRRYYPTIGLAVVALVLYWAVTWYADTDSKLASRAVIIVAGFAIGFVLHRSRFCLSRVFREPFMTGEGAMTKAMILALALGIPLGSLLLHKQTVDPYLAIPARFWLGSMTGGLVFGIGMIFAGGCASGSLWRIGEGHLKLVVAALSFGWIGSVFSGILKRWNLLSAEFDIDFLDGIPEVTALGYQAWLPDLLQGWGGVFAISFGVLALWYLLVRYNESTEKLTVL
ncbi:MAG: YeeE/YedE family protein, partial [Pseudomonadota bacterium]